MTDAADFLGMLKDPKGYSMKMAMAALKEECTDIVDVNMELDEFTQEEVWIVDITGNNVAMFQHDLEQALERQIYKHTNYWLRSSRTPRYISNLNDRQRDGYCAQEFTIGRKTIEI